MMANPNIIQLGLGIEVLLIAIRFKNDPLGMLTCS